MADVESLKALLTRVGFPPDSLEPISIGSSSEAWKVVAHGEAFAFRIFNPHRGHRPSYESEFGLRARLRESTELVPEPIATNRDFSSDLSGSGEDWIIDRFVEGEFFKRGEPLPKQALIGLSEVFQALHDLECHGFGAPKNVRTEFTGTQSSYIDGLNVRFPDLWPFRGPSLDDHPVSELAPELVAGLLGVAEQVLQLREPNLGAIAHFDLHNEQLILANGKLSALIDFGDAVICGPAWDFASFAYFHSQKSAMDLVSAYAPDTDVATELMSQARLFAVLIGVHHVRRSFALDRPARREFALKRIRNLLENSTPN